jgi:cytochrome c5
MCHTAGLMNAPKIGDKGQWAPRIAQGYDVLVSHAINGIRSMPARGGNPALTDGEIANAVANMANASGASFKAPVAKAVPAADPKAADAAVAPAK